MPIVQYNPTGSIFQVEGFPEGTKEKPFARSREGSIHLRPNATYELTMDEYSFIKEKYPLIARNLRVLAHKPEERKSPSVPEWQDANVAEADRRSVEGYAGAARSGDRESQESSEGPIKYEEVPDEQQQGPEGEPLPEQDSNTGATRRRPE